MAVLPLGLHPDQYGVLLISPEPVTYQRSLTSYLVDSLLSRKRRWGAHGEQAEAPWIERWVRPLCGRERRRINPHHDQIGGSLMAFRQIGVSCPALARFHLATMGAPDDAAKIACHAHGVLPA
jgi:hypothetical protein